jgi:hypothetical protein
LLEVTGIPTEGFLTRSGRRRQPETLAEKRLAADPRRRMARGVSLFWRVRGFVLANPNLNRGRGRRRWTGSPKRRRRAVIWTLRAVEPAGGSGEDAPGVTRRRRIQLRRAGRSWGEGRLAEGQEQLAAIRTRR